MTARADYDDQQLTKLELVKGPWPHDKVMSVEQGSEDSSTYPRAGKVYIKVNDREMQVGIGGEVYNPLSQPAYFGGTAQFYADPLYYERLVGDSDYSQLRSRRQNGTNRRSQSWQAGCRTSWNSKARTSGRSPIHTSTFSRTRWMGCSSCWG